MRPAALYIMEDIYLLPLLQSKRVRGRDEVMNDGSLNDKGSYKISLALVSVSIFIFHHSKINSTTIQYL